MSDRESMLSFLENFNQEDEDVNTQQVEEEDVETPAADSASMLLQL
jgi:hypothetical protein